MLFSLYSAARAALERAVNPREARENEAQLQGLERERTFLMRVNDEIAGVHEAFDTQETRASIRTWGSRASSAFIGSVATYIAALTVS